MEEYRYIKLVSRTYFKKGIEVSIDDVKEGDLVYLSIKSPLNYGIRTWQYWGMISGYPSIAEQEPRQHESLFPSSE